MKIDFNYDSINVQADLIDNICVFCDKSGTGKTFLFSILECYFEYEDIKYCSFNYLNYRALENYDFSGAEVVILDNADLYMSEELFNRLEKSNKLEVMSIRSIGMLEMKNMGFYKICYKDDKIRAVRFA